MFCFIPLFFDSPYRCRDLIYANEYLDRTSFPIRGIVWGVFREMHESHAACRALMACHYAE